METADEDVLHPATQKLDEVSVSGKPQIPTGRSLYLLQAGAERKKNFKPLVSYCFQGNCFLY